ncbi:hypothetical protein [Amycolatopsis saalfeldensis]|uniref:Uncharacterized protein n=1 Tax=Amycolatopsis saalfeldensis TaxID=394193 RepID=A0A1H8VIT5_9PSEU|nr:hypothetical protein [Amycolatopsis saalfeldensis]SEP15233.1 hypothetical protein SAMN04489732_10482 [Amycolatopsis saalfeldensis]
MRGGHLTLELTVPTSIAPARVVVHRPPGGDPSPAVHVVVANVD